MIDSNELIKAVAKWGDDHKLNDPVMQYAKVNEEIGEIAHEITQGRNRGQHSYAYHIVQHTWFRLCRLLDAGIHRDKRQKR